MTIAPPASRAELPAPDWRDVVAATPGAVLGWARAVVRAVVTPRRWTARWTAFGVLGVLYVVLSVLIVIPGTPVLRLDSYLLNLHLWHYHPSWYRPVSIVVAFGQRWIMTYILQLIFIWAAFRARSIKPLVLFGSALLVLNVSVGLVKYALGRIGPMHQNNPHDVFQLGGNIFPSGHVSNTVVLYGVLAWALPRHRKALTAFAVAIAVAVGLGTVYMRTHWFSDVMGGWIAGSMVLLSLPSVLPTAQRLAERLVVWIRSALAPRPRLRAALRRIVDRGLAHIPPDPTYVSARGVAEPAPQHGAWLLSDGLAAGPVAPVRRARAVSPAQR